MYDYLIQKHQPKVVQLRAKKTGDDTKQGDSGTVYQCMQRELQQVANSRDIQQVRRDNQPKQQILEKDQQIQYLQVNNDHLTKQNQQLQESKWCLQEENNQLTTQIQDLRQQNKHYDIQNQSFEQQVEQQGR